MCWSFCNCLSALPLCHRVTLSCTPCPISRKSQHPAKGSLVHDEVTRSPAISLPQAVLHVSTQPVAMAAFFSESVTASRQLFLVTATMTCSFSKAFLFCCADALGPQVRGLIVFHFGLRCWKSCPPALKGTAQKSLFRKHLFFQAIGGHTSTSPLRTWWFLL